MKSDAELLQLFAETRDDGCFAEIVQRHLGFVYAVSLRRLRDPHAAQDAAQAVFIALARKAGTVARAPSILGWLHRSACYETNNLMRAQANRRARETEAQRLGSVDPEARPQLEAIDAVLDEVLCELPESDRTLLLARFFSNQTYPEMGASLRLSENAARMRVDRALARLREQLARRGVTSTATALAAALPSYASATVPSGLTATVTQASVAGLGATTAAAAIFTSMSTAKLVTGAVAAGALGGLAYQYHHTTQLQHEVTVARAESAVSAEQLQTIQQELAELKRQAREIQQRAGGSSRSGGGSGPADSTAAVTPPPKPGVTPKAPPGWFQNGSANHLYEVGVDANESWGGMPSAYAQSIGPAEGKFGGMMQTISAEAFLDQRVRLTGWVKTEDVAKGAQLWLRVDGPESGKSLQFDNMSGRAPTGTSDWEEYSIVLDVPPESTTLNYGFFVAGEGKMWVNGLTITPVGTDVPSTHRPRPALPATPVNLGFAPPPSG